MNPNSANRICFVLSVALTLFLYLAPIPPALSYPFVWLSTLAHELGHGIAALLLGGDFKSFEMWSDGSGVARTATSNSRLGNAFVSAGGLVGPALAATVCFFFARTEKRARVGSYALAVLGLVALIAVVRNLFGFMFVATLSVLSLALAHKAKPWLSQVWVTLLGVQLGLSVFSRGDYLFTDKAVTANGTMPSDTAAMAEALFLPYWFWGMLCGAFSIAVLLLGLKLIWKPVGTTPTLELPPPPPR